MGGTIPSQELMKRISNDQLVADWPAGTNLEERVQASSVDLSVGAVVSADASVTDEGVYWLPPGGMAVILTKERLKIPDDLCGTSFAPNFKSVEGLLILNPGHLDPGYEGPITARVINFGRMQKPIRVGEPFVTVIFCQLTNPTEDPYARSPSRQEYLNRLRESSLTTMSSTIDEFFSDEIEKRVEERLRDEFLNRREAPFEFLKYLVTVAAALVGVEQIRTAILNGADELPPPFGFYKDALIWFLLAMIVLYVLVHGGQRVVEAFGDWFVALKKRWWWR